MNDQIKPGQWWQHNYSRLRCRIVGRDHQGVLVVEWFRGSGRSSIETYSPDSLFLENFAHMPDCTGPDWRPPKPEEWVVPTDADACRRVQVRVRDREDRPWSDGGTLMGVVPGSIFLFRVFDSNKTCLYGYRYAEMRKEDRDGSFQK